MANPESRRKSIATEVAPASPGARSLCVCGKLPVSLTEAATAVNALPPQDPKLLRRLLRAKDRMDAASHEDWPIARLAQVSHVSPAHFARSFKQAFGVPPHRYLLTRRIERAVALLRDTTLPTTEIALRTGWRSLGTFGRVFRDITGETPGQARARWRDAGPQHRHVPACIVGAAQRPHLKIAVSEKRRHLPHGTKEPTHQLQENDDEPGNTSGRHLRARSG